MPRVIVSDNNEQFKGTFVDYCKVKGINNEYTAPYSPEMNSVERVHGTLMNRIRALRYSTGKPWKSCLQVTQLSYNMAEHSMLEESPFALLFAKDYDLMSNSYRDINHIGDLRDKAKSQALKKREGRLKKINSQRKDQDISIGDWVYIKATSTTKLSNKVLEDKYQVVGFRSKNILELESKNYQKLTRSRKDVILVKAVEVLGKEGSI